MDNKNISRLWPLVAVVVFVAVLLAVPADWWENRTFLNVCVVVAVAVGLLLVIKRNNGSRKKEVEELNRIIESNDVPALRKMLKRSIATASLFCLFGVAFTVYLLFFSAGWSWVGILFPLCVVLTLIVIVRNGIALHKLKHVTTIRPKE